MKMVTKKMPAGLAGVFLLFTGGAHSEETDITPSAEELAAYEFTHVSCKGEPHEIRIVVDGLKKSAGLITADLYPNKQDGFLMGRSRIKQVKFAAKAPQTRFCVTAPEDGDFAIAIYHDVNANGHFDKTGLGLPNEPWGLSMNPRVRFAPPHVSKTLFPVTESGAKVTINLK